MTDEDKLSFLDEQPTEPEAAQEASEPITEDVQPEPEPEQELGETPAHEAVEPEPEPAAPPAVEEPQQSAPITALLDEREKRQNAERQMQQLQQQLAQLQAAQQPKEAPDFFEDPQRAAQHYIAPLQQQLQAQKLEMSKFHASQAFGEDVVAEAMTFFDQNPALSHQFIEHPSPFHAAVEFYKKQKVLADMGSDPEAYINQQVEARMQAKMQEQATRPAAPKAPPPSMAKAPTQGKDAISSGNTFDQMFPS